MTPIENFWEYPFNRDWPNAIEKLQISTALYAQNKLLAIIAIFGTETINILFNTFYIIDSLLQ